MIFLSLVLTFNIGTSIASYEFNQRVRPRLEKSSIKVDSFITEGFRAPATISNATYEDIMMELGWMPQVASSIIANFKFCHLYIIKLIS